MTCKKCGREIADGIKFCPNCGQAVVEETTVSQPNETIQPVTSNQPFVEPQPSPVNNAAPATEQKKSSKAPIIIICVVLFIFVILPFIFVLLFMGIIKKSGESVRNITTTRNSDIIIERTTTPEEPTTTESIIKEANWKNYNVTVNGKGLTLPCSYAEFSSITGASMKDTQADNSIDRNYYMIANLYKNDKLAMSIEILNDTAGTIKQKDAKVTRVSQTKYNKTSADTDIVFPGGLKPGMTVDEETIKKALGTPTDIKNYESGNYKSVTYIYNADTTYTTTNYYKITVVNGVIDDLTLDHRNY